MNFKPVIHKHTSAVLGLFVNVHIVETSRGVILIDGGVAVDPADEIRDFIDNKIKKPILGVLLTHGHPDHYVGVGQILKGDDVPFIATRDTYEQVVARDEEESEGMRQAFMDNYPAHKVFPNQIIEDGESVVFDDIAFTIKNCGPAESDSDSIWSFVDNGIQHVFCGDLLYNHMHLFMKDGHALEWLKVLDWMQEYYSSNTVFYPAHGEVCGSEIIFWNRAYIKMFLHTLKQLLRGRDALGETEKNELFKRVKSFFPDEKLMNLLQFKIDETIKKLSNFI